MDPTLGQLVNSWANWLNSILKNPSLPLLVRIFAHDAGNEVDAAMEKASLHVTSVNNHATPAVLGLVSRDTGKPVEDDEDEGDDNIVGNDVFAEQIEPLRSKGQFFCFVAKGSDKISFYVCQDGSGGRVPMSENLVVDGAFGGQTFDRNKHAREIRRIMMDVIAANLAQVAMAPPSRFR